jgi:HPt (histidine-containing phosphotransfer) domain-containing protein
MSAVPRDGGDVDRDHDRDLDAALAALQAEYAGELPGLVQALAALVEAGRTDPEAAARARRAAHRIRGTAGSYGFHAVGEAAGRIEDALEAGEAVGPELVLALRALVASTVASTIEPPGSHEARSSGSSK